MKEENFRDSFSRESKRKTNVWAIFCENMRENKFFEPFFERKQAGKNFQAIFREYT